MNIFKILANGYGTVNENNVSAFISYLLDPNENHSLGTEFLKRFIQEILSDEDFDVNLYDYELFLEQGFKGGLKKEKLKKEVVDIVILCYKTNKGNKSQDELVSFINNDKELIKLFLIENKIKSGANTTNQLLRQRGNAIKSLKIENEIVNSIFLTPDTPEFNKEFDNCNGDYMNHFYWNIKEDSNKNEVSILSILKDILVDESNGKIEAISDYTKHTLKAFIQFIDNDFKSSIQLNKAKKEGFYQRDLHNNVESLILKYPNLINNDSIYILEEFIKHIKNIKDITFRLSKSHPISVFYKGKKIFGLHKHGKNFLYDIIYRNFEGLELLNESLCNEFNLKHYIDKNMKKGVRLEPNNLDIDEVQKIFDKIIKQLYRRN